MISSCGMHLGMTVKDRPRARTSSSMADSSPELQLSTSLMESSVRNRKVETEGGLTCCNQPVCTW